MGSHTRVHYMDNLRAFAMLLGVVFHAALAYSPMLHQLWLTSDPQQSAVVDFVAYFTHTFRMPLFFIIAGYFAALLVTKRGISGMLKNRLLRIVLPFAIFLPLIIIAFMVIIGWALESVEQKSPMLGFFAMMANVPDAPPPPLTTSHLWFLYNLIFFYAIAAIIVKYVAFDWVSKVLNYPRLFLVFSPILLIPALASQSAPFPAPEQFMPQLWSFGFYGLLFAMGWGLFKQPNLLDKLAPYSLAMLIIAIAAYVGFYFQLPEQVSLQQMMAEMASGPELTLQHLFMAGAEAYMAVYMSLALLVFGKRYLNQQNTLVRYIADSSYWVYIIHLPVLWLIQFYLLDTDYSWQVELLISVLGTMLVGLLSYALLVRWTPIGWLLNGRKLNKNDNLASLASHS